MTGWSAYLGESSSCWGEWFTAAGSRFAGSQGFLSLMLTAGSSHGPTAVHVSWLAGLRLTGSHRCISVTSAF